MGSVNKVILVGRLGQDPEHRHLEGGKQVAKFSLATSERFKGEEQTEWHNIVCWGKTAEAVSKYVQKGSEIYIEGRIKGRSWEDKDGNKRSATDIVAQSVTFIGKKSEVRVETGDDDLPF